MNLVVSKRADHDLDQIISYSEDEYGSSEWVSGQMEDAFDHLLQWPYSGHQRLEFLSSAYLFWNVAPYVIVYTIQGDDLVIVAVRHGARDLIRLANLP